MDDASARTAVDRDEWRTEQSRPSSSGHRISRAISRAVSPARSLTLPGAAGLGILALTPLGPDFVAHGILAGLYTAIFLPLTAVVLGSATAA
jgi:hypothetical protein